MHLTGTCLVLIGLLNVSVAQLASLAAAALGSLARKEVLDLMAKHVIPKIPDLLEEGIKLDFHENSLHFRFLINIRAYRKRAFFVRLLGTLKGI